MRRFSVALLSTVMFVLVASVVFAQSPIFDDTVSSCTGINCSSLRIPGTVLSFSPSAGNFVINAFATPGNCVRFDVISEGTDLEMVVTAPNGQVFRNDDSFGPCFLCPLVKIASAPNNGWYTVRLAHFNGAAVNANFTLLYGRYSAGNPNCAAPTVPFSASIAVADEEAKAEKLQLTGSDTVLPPLPHQPGHE